MGTSFTKNGEWFVCMERGHREGQVEEQRTDRASLLDAAFLCDLFCGSVGCLHGVYRSLVYVHQDGYRLLWGPQSSHRVPEKVVRDGAKGVHQVEPHEVQRSVATSCVLHHGVHQEVVFEAPLTLYEPLL